jgi:hypothetical protein
METKKSGTCYGPVVAGCDQTWALFVALIVLGRFDDELEGVVHCGADMWYEKGFLKCWLYTSRPNCDSHGGDGPENFEMKVEAKKTKFQHSRDDTNNDSNPTRPFYR